MLLRTHHQGLVTLQARALTTLLQIISFRPHKHGSTDWAGKQGRKGGRERRKGRGEREKERKIREGRSQGKGMTGLREGERKTEKVGDNNGSRPADTMSVGTGKGKYQVP